MSELQAGLLADFVEAARDPEVPAHELGVLAQELDATIGQAPTEDAMQALAPLLTADGPELFVTGVLLGGWVERGGPPQPLAPLIDRLPTWVDAAARDEPEAWTILTEVWRPLVAALGAWPEARRRSAEQVGDRIEGFVEAHPELFWLARLLRVPEQLDLRLIVPDRGEDLRLRATNVVDVMHLSILVNGALEPDFSRAAVACAQGEGPQMRRGSIALPRVLTAPDGEVLPEGADLSILPTVEGLPLVVAMKNPEPFVRPIGRPFATMKSSLQTI